jgi:hypothetical protein
LLAKNLLSKATPARLLRALGLEAPVAPGGGDGTQIPLKMEDLTDGVGIAGYSAEEYEAYVRSSRLVARELQLAPGAQALVVNGRVSAAGPRCCNASANERLGRSSGPLTQGTLVRWISRRWRAMSCGGG